MMLVVLFDRGPAILELWYAFENWRFVFSHSGDPIYDRRAMDALDVGQHDPSSLCRIDISCDIPHM